MNQSTIMARPEGEALDSMQWYRDKLAYNAAYGPAYIAAVERSLSGDNDRERYHAISAFMHMGYQGLRIWYRISTPWRERDGVDYESFDESDRAGKLYKRAMALGEKHGMDTPIIYEVSGGFFHATWQLWSDSSPTLLQVGRAMDANGVMP